MPVWNKIADHEIQEVRRAFLITELTIEQIAETVGRSFHTVHRIIEREFTKEERLARKRVCYCNSRLGDKNPAWGKFGAKHPNYKNGHLNKQGYLVVQRPGWYAARTKCKNVFAHHIIVCLGLGLTCIPAGYQVHHCDTNPLNNWFVNLALLSMAAHTKVHAAIRRGELGSATTISKESTLKWVEAHGGGVWHR